MYKSPEKQYSFRYCRNTKLSCLQGDYPYRFPFVVFGFDGVDEPSLRPPEIAVVGVDVEQVEGPELEVLGFDGEGAEERVEGEHQWLRPLLMSLATRVPITPTQAEATENGPALE